MTLAFPDVSNHNGAMALLAQTVACLAKATEGTTYRDPYYAHYKAEAARVGALFGAYHFLREGDGAAQARFAYSVIGPGVPTMLDFEPEYDQSGQPISQPTMADATAFRDTFRSLGGLIRLNYLPRWYWAGRLGSPSLAPLAELALVSSDYEAYSDNGPGWAPYGGVDPQIWQYTDRQPYSGQPVDFNAYRGTLDQLRALLGFASPEADMVAWTDKITGPNGRPDGNVVQNILTDLGRLRDYLTGDPTAAAPYGATSPLAQITAAARVVPGIATQLSALSAAVSALEAKVAALSAPTVDPAALAAAAKAALQDPGVLKALAHALAVELHGDTPAS